MKTNFALPWQSEKQTAPVAANKSPATWERLFDDLFLFCGVEDCWPVPSHDEIFAGEES